MMTVLNDYRLDPHHDNVAPLIKYPLTPTGGAYYEYLPWALAHFGVSYTLRPGLDIKELQEILDRGHPVISYIAENGDIGRNPHVIVVDKIEKDHNQGPKFVCIRDSGTRDFAAYKVPVADFERVWGHRDIVPNF